MVLIKTPTFEHRRDGDNLGIGESKPRISWKFIGKDKDWSQSSYDIEITRGSNSESRLFHVESPESVLVPWPDEPLTSKGGVTVRIRATGKSGAEPSSWSDSVTVEAGLLSSEDWTATLVGAPRNFAENGSHRPAIFRKHFKLPGIVDSARLYITSHGTYDARINGDRVGDHILAPGWTSYQHHLAYQTFDIKGHLKEGDNVIDVEIGEGWFATRLGWAGGKRNIYGDQLALLAQLEIILADGKRLSIDSDGSWRTSVGPIISSEIYDGESYDASLELRDRGLPTFDDGAWASVHPLKFPTAQLISSKGPPVRKIETLGPQRIFKSPKKQIIIDFGQNIVGWLKISVSGPKGHKIQFSHAEVLDQDGECAFRPLRDCLQRDSLTLSGEAIKWEPKFTFHGFRYVQVDNWPSETGEPSKSDITAVVLHTDMEQTGYFECSERLVNRLHENIRWGMKGNFLSVPTDCPQRDERLGWTGDIQIFAPTGNFLYNTAGMLSGWLQDLAAEQLKDYNGTPPLVCPNVIGDAMSKAQAAWADATIITPHDLYTTFGDPKILSEHYEAMKTWISTALPRGPNGLWDPKVHQLGDWLDPAAPPSEPGKGRTDPHLVANAYLVRITDTMGIVSKVLELHKDYDHYISEAAKTRKSFQDEYITPKGRLAPDTMTSLSLGLAFNLFRNSTETSYAAERLTALVRFSNFKIATGFVGTPLILPALTTAGHVQIAYRMLLEKRCPSWLYPISLDATTMWERWDSMLPDGSVNPGSMTSFNHYALGSVGAWLHSTVGGISALEPGWKKILIKPVPGGTITWAKTKFGSPYGTVTCDWEIEKQKFRMTVGVPPNTTALVVLPGQETGEEVGSGEYKFDVPYEQPGQWPPTALIDPFSTPEDEPDRE